MIVYIPGTRTSKTRETSMGLEKRADFDHSQESVFEAAGYSDETVTEELEPRAMLLAHQLVHAALNDPETALNVLLDSPVLGDKKLDSRDRAIIVMMAGRSLGKVAIQQLNDPYGSFPGTGLQGTSGERVAGEHHGPIRIGKVEWDTIVHHVEHKVFGGRPRKESEHVERMQEVLDDEGLSPVQKAVVEVLVLKNWATEGQSDTSLADVVEGRT
jgi:hypothetical protein